MRPFAIAVRVGLVALVALHVLVLGGTRLVCRYTQAVMDDCCCTQEEAGFDPALRDACCCDVRHSGHLQAVSVRTEPPSLAPPTLVLAISTPGATPLPAKAGFLPAVRARIPDRPAVYLTTRQLLL